MRVGDPRRHRLRCPQDGVETSRDCRHISESVRWLRPPSAYLTHCGGKSPNVCRSRIRNRFVSTVSHVCAKGPAGSPCSCVPLQLCVNATVTKRRPVVTRLWQTPGNVTLPRLRPPLGIRHSVRPGTGGNGASIQVLFQPRSAIRIASAERVALSALCEAAVAGPATGTTMTVMTARTRMPETEFIRLLSNQARKLTSTSSLLFTRETYKPSRSWRAGYACSQRPRAFPYQPGRRTHRSPDSSQLDSVPRRPRVVGTVG